MGFPRAILVLHVKVNFGFSRGSVGFFWVPWEYKYESGFATL